MAICNCCLQEMLSPATISCTQVVEFPDGETMLPVPFSGDDRCHDCKVINGGLHHPGCDGEHCPRCGGQLISCGCLDGEGDD